MKKKILLSLFFGFFNCVSAAEQIKPVEELASKVDSLQLLALKFMKEKSIVSPFKKNFLGRPCPKDVNSYVSNEIAKIAVEELKKNPDDRRSPYEEFKELNPDITLFLNAHKIFYSLSVQDLYSMKVRVDFENEEYYNAIDHYYEGVVENPLIRDLNLSTLALTSLEGLEVAFDTDFIDSLDVSNNQLTNIEPVILKLLNLKRLNFSYNYLGKYFVPNGLLFEQLQDLQEINYFGNQDIYFICRKRHPFLDSDEDSDSDEESFKSKRLCKAGNESVFDNK